MSRQLLAAQFTYNQVIDFILEYSTDEPIAFLHAWREGDWESITNEWPEFDLTASTQPFDLWPVELQQQAGLI